MTARDSDRAREGGRAMTETTTPITRIQVIGYEWFDKINGNSYCSARVYVNDELAAHVPFQYGYDDAYLQYAAGVLDEAGIVTMERSPYGGLEPLWRYCDDRGIELLSSKHTKLKREVKAWGESDNDGSER